MELVIRGGTLVTMNAEREVLAADVLVRDGRISLIGPELDETTSIGDREIVDASGMLILPGLVQAHVHLCQTLLRGRADDLPLLGWLKTRVWPYEAALDEAAMRASASVACLELLRGGTTAILDMGSVRHTDVIFEVARTAGIRATIGKAHMDAGDDLPAGLREKTEASLAEGEALCERWHGSEGGRLRYAFAPRFALSCSEGLLREVGQLARRMKARLHSHASENRDECAVVKATRGQDNIVYFDGLGLLGRDVALAHCVWLSAEERALLARTGTHVVHCPSSNLKLGSGVCDVVSLLEAGVNVAVGADGAPCNDSLDAFLETRLAALLQRPGHGSSAMPARRALELATLGGAKALGLEKEIGSIEAGKRADLVIVDPGRAHAAPVDDPYAAVVFALNRSDVRDVFVDGRQVVRNGIVTTLDEAAVVADARSQIHRLDVH
jgi:cytosine/adenosine deaminase-related metal-dependent hydrolase